jgi:glycosyltransferase involved in cell wall biosynthesis
MPVSLSVIIPTLNEEKYLPNLLTDLSKQSFTDFEVIIIDAGSTDQTKKQAENFANKFSSFQFVLSDKKGVCYQKNLGAKLAKAPYLLFLDADDRLPSYFILGLKYHQERLNPDFLSTQIFPDTNNKKDRAIAYVVNLYMDLQKDTERPSFLESALLVKKTSFQRIKGFDKNLNWGEGGDLVFRAKKRNLSFFLVANPKHTYSLRRIRKLGTLNTLRRSAYLEFARKINFQLSDQKTKNLYPMEGGVFFDISEKRKARIKAIVEAITKLNSIANTPIKTKGLWESLKQKFGSKED